MISLYLLRTFTPSAGRLEADSGVKCTNEIGSERGTAAVALAHLCNALKLKKRKLKSLVDTLLTVHKREE